MANNETPKQKRGQMEHENANGAGNELTEEDLWSLWHADYKWPLQLVNQIPDYKLELSLAEAKREYWKTQMNKYFRLATEGLTADGYDFDEVLNFKKRESSSVEIAWLAVESTPAASKNLQAAAKKKFLDSGLVSEDTDLGKDIKEILRIDPEAL